MAVASLIVRFKPDVSSQHPRGDAAMTIGGRS
jgi:hypothetical protein